MTADGRGVDFLACIREQEEGPCAYYSEAKTARNHPCETERKSSLSFDGLIGVIKGAPQRGQALRTIPCCVEPQKRDEMRRRFRKPRIETPLHLLVPILRQ